MRLFEFARGHPSLVAALVVVFFLPWVWMAFLVPFWAMAASFALVPIAALVALALILRDLDREDEGPDASLEGDDPLKWRRRTRLFQQVVVGLDTMLERWDALAASSHPRLVAANESVEEAIRVTEAAVAGMSRDFRIVVAKAKEQTEAAMSLLRGGGDGGGSGIVSLPKFIESYDQQLANLTAYMTDFSEAAGEMERHQQRVAEHARVMEETIEELRNMSSRISRIALDASVAMTSQTLSSGDFVEMTDRIRAISADAHDLARRTRQGLDAIGDEVRQGNRRTTQVAVAARHAVETTRVEIERLSGATIDKTRQIETTLQRINELSREIQDDINRIVVAMQFQDITRQKLERDHKSPLDATAQSLFRLSHETRSLLQRDLYRAVRAYSESAIRVRPEEPAAGAGEGPPSPAPGPGDEKPVPPERKVELF